MHRIDVEMGGQRNEGLEIFTPRGEGSSTFDQTSYNSDGTVEHATGSFDAQGRYHNDLPDSRATLTFVGDDLMRASWERRDARGDWVPWMEVELTREAEPHIEIRSKDDHSR
ncbi:hypothetical protein [Nocardioides nanhaiensis]|uniref:Uncharacterized protein n=1 Tax=Nocardioides nanhaiensis TaxID=1476871 RepID=A0ABP8W1R7_9ACTN